MAANVDRPNGAKPIGTINGSPWSGTIEHFLADGSGSDIFPGDFVEANADGFIDVATAGSTDIIGVCVGFMAQQAGQTSGVTDHFLGNTSFNLDKRYYDASVDGESWIAVSVGPNVLYEIQTDGTIQFTDIGNNADITATAGDTTTGQSKHEVSATTTTGTANLRLIRPVNRPDNDISEANSRWVVKINEHHYTVIDDGGTAEGGEGL